MIQGSLNVSPSTGRHPSTFGDCSDAFYARKLSRGNARAFPWYQTLVTRATYIHRVRKLSRFRKLARHTRDPRPPRCSRVKHRNWTQHKNKTRESLRAKNDPAEQALILLVSFTTREQFSPTIVCSLSDEVGKLQLQLAYNSSYVDVDIIML